MSQLTTHVLDIAYGTPAVGVAVSLDRQTEDGWSEVGSGVTNADGRIPLLGADQVEAGVYRLTFAVGDYFQATHRPSFYPEVQVTFRVSGIEHLHLPLLLSTFGYSTYRGS